MRNTYFCCTKNVKKICVKIYVYILDNVWITKLNIYIYIYIYILDNVWITKLILNFQGLLGTEELEYKIKCNL